MKKTMIAFIAALFAAVPILTGCGGRVVDKAPVTSPGPTSQTAENAEYIVRFTDGLVEKETVFDWEFFINKSGVGRTADIKIISSVNGTEKEFFLSYDGSVFIFKTEDEELNYKYLINYVADIRGRGYRSAEFSVLSDEPDLSAEDFFGGSPKDNVRVGDITEKGIVVYTNYR